MADADEIGVAELMMIGAGVVDIGAGERQQGHPLVVLQGLHVGRVAAVGVFCESETTTR